METAELLDYERPEWHQRAACRTVPPNVMFPLDAQGVAAARRICADCPVRPECAAQGLRERDGIWGGQSERQRAQLRRKAGIQTPPRESCPHGHPYDANNDWLDCKGHRRCLVCNRLDQADRRQGDRLT